MNVLGDRIKNLRKSKKLNQEQLSDALNKQFGLKTDRVMISKWETGFQTPVIHTIKCIATFFGVSIDYLNGEPNQKYTTPTITDDTVTFPVIGEIAAGYDHIALEDWTGDTVEIPTSYLKGRKTSEFFVLKVKGDSMYPMYQEDDKVLILKQSTLNYSGQIGAILYDDDCATLKKVEFANGEDWMRLVPINPSHPPKTIRNADLERCKVMGIPKLLIREIDIETV